MQIPHCYGLAVEVLGCELPIGWRPVASRSCHRFMVRKVDINLYYISYMVNLNHFYGLTWVVIMVDGQ